MATDTKPLQDEFDLAFDLYADAIFRHCSFKLFDRERSKELTQDAFMRYWECLQRGEKIENTRAFLYRIANNLIIDHIRKKKEISLDKLQEEGFEPGEESMASMHDRLDGQKAVRLLKKLDDPYRQALTLRFVEGLEVQEIADILEEKPNTVSVHIHRGLKQLRTYLDHAG